jgi:hypothetical protein
MAVSINYGRLSVVLMIAVFVLAAGLLYVSLYPSLPEACYLLYNGETFRVTPDDLYASMNQSLKTCFRACQLKNGTQTIDYIEPGNQSCTWSVR